MPMIGRADQEAELNYANRKSATAYLGLSKTNSLPKVLIGLW